MRPFFAGVVFPLSLFLLSCSVGRVAVNNHESRDSISHIDSTDHKTFVRDSVFVFVKGDTIIVREYHYKEKEVTHEKSDNNSHNDSEFVQPAPEKYIPPWCWWCVGVCAFLLLIVVVVIVWRVCRRFV